MKKVHDHIGNEVKEGMTIYLVQTKPFVFGKIGMFIPAGISKSGKVEEIWESEDEYQKRKNTNIWELGEPYLVWKDDDGDLYINQVTKGINELAGYTFYSRVHLDFRDVFDDKKDKIVIAIKGISDKNPNQGESDERSVATEAK